MWKVPCSVKQWSTARSVSEISTWYRLGRGGRRAKARPKRLKSYTSLYD